EDADSLFAVFNVEVHGLYRLAEWISPDLVTGFDVTTPFPWDAEFHAWTQTHDRVLEGVNFSDIAPLVRDAVLDLKYPDWWIQTPNAAKAAEQYRAEQLKICELWLLNFGNNPESVAKIVTETGARNIKSVPALLTPCMRWVARNWKRQIEAAGGSAEIR